MSAVRVSFESGFGVACLALSQGLSGCGDDADDTGTSENGVEAGSSAAGSGGSSAGAGGSAAGSGGSSAGAGGRGGSSGSAGAAVDPAAVQACVGGHFDGVDSACAQCMCECDPMASECDELCWELANCTYVHCQMTNNQGLSSQTECVLGYCGGYLDSTQGAYATSLTPCFSQCGSGACVSWWIMQVPQDGSLTGEDAGI